MSVNIYSGYPQLALVIEMVIYRTGLSVVFCFIIIAMDMTEEVNTGQI